VKATEEVWISFWAAAETEKTSPGYQNYNREFEIEKAPPKKYI
jgi:hypothetical protein